jgi:hypothetical protein
MDEKEELRGAGARSLWNNEKVSKVFGIHFDCQAF